ncbi:MAG: H-NS histone family protein [Pseudomonadota bacterium]
MAKIDLSKLNHKELVKLQKDVEKAIKNFEKRRLDEARSAVEAKARELGFSLTQLTGGKGAAKPKNPPKYQHAENAELTWSGRGRQPAWIKEHLAAGKSLDDLAI